MLKRVFSVIIFILAISPVHAQDTFSVFFLGVTDLNKDGQITVDDPEGLYVATATVGARLLSAPDVDVSRFAVNADATLAAYIGDTPKSDVLGVIFLGEGSDNDRKLGFAVPDLQLNQITVVGDTIWITGLDAVRNRHVIRGINPETGETINQRVLSLEGSQVELHPNGQYANGYNDNEAVIATFTLPTLEEIEYDVFGYAVTVPQWSERTDRFMLVVGEDQSRENLQLLIVDVAEPRTFEPIDVPDYERRNRVSANWSDYGNYISYTSIAPAEHDGLLILDVDSGETVTLQEDGLILNVLQWSLDDRYALVQGLPREIAEDAPVVAQLFVYDSAIQELFALSEIIDIEAAELRWNPTVQTLAISGQSLQTGIFGIYTVDVEAREAQIIVESFDADITRGILDWNADGSQLVFLATSPDNPVTTFALPTALFGLDPASSVITRLSPEGVIIDSLRILVY